MEPKFSVVLIAKNEAKTLPRLLASLAEFRERGGEIVLVDTGSTDATAQIARDAGCKVEEVGERFIRTISEEEAEIINDRYVKGEDADIVHAGDRNFDYSAARNYAATLAKNDMVAMPDCDEAYTKLDINALDAVIASGNVSQFEYNFVYAHDTEGNAVIEFAHSKFYDRTKMKWTGIIHEVLAGKEAYTGATKMPESVIKLEHWQNMETPRGHYLTGLALAVFEDPNNDRNSFYFGRELMYTGRLASAVAELERHIAMDKWPAERAQSMIYIGDCFDRMGAPDQALAWYLKAFQVSPNRREPLMRMAEYYYRIDSPDHVIPLVAAALQITQPDSFYGNHQPYYENIPHEMMYWALYRKGEVSAAFEHFMICLGYQPFNEKYLEAYRWFMPLPQVQVMITGDDPDAAELTRKSIADAIYPQEKILYPMVMEEFIAKEKAWTLKLEAGMALDRAALMTAYKVALDNRKNKILFNINNDAEKKGAELFMNSVKEVKDFREMWVPRAKVQTYSPE